MTWRAVTFSLTSWGGLALYLFFRWNGLTFRTWFTPLWLLLLVPYVTILVLLMGRSSPGKVWLAFGLSLTIGMWGTFEYCERTIVNLSGMSGMVFYEVPLLQTALVLLALTAFGILRHFWRKSHEKENGRS